MSVQTEIDRLETAKAAIGTAIAGKGVAVPSGTKLDGMAALINGIEQGSDPVLQSKTVSPTTSSQTVKPDSGYDGLSQVTVNAMPTATQATPSISVSSAGLITASATQSAGYVTAGTKKATKQLTVQAAQTITPGTADQTISSGRYLTGTQTIKGDSNLVADNIKAGVNIFGVAGTFEGGGGGGGGGVSLETCTVTLDTSKAGTGKSGNAIWITVENDEIQLKNVYFTSPIIISMLYQSITCLKGTEVVLGYGTNTKIPNLGNLFSVSGGVELVKYEANTLGASFKVTGDGSIAWIK